MDILQLKEIMNFNTPGSYYKSLPSGFYFFECYGAQGGGKGGRGGFSQGVYEIKKEEQIMVNVGGCPEGQDGGINGGGKASEKSGSFLKGYGGGGASDIRIGNYELDDRIIVAGGGGGSGSSDASGGDGGGDLGANGEGSYGGKGAYEGTPGKGGIFNEDEENSNGQDGQKGIGGNAARGHSNELTKGSGGGGGGYYGGGGGGTDVKNIWKPGNGGGGGGSGYIGGVADLYYNGILVYERKMFQGQKTSHGQIKIYQIIFPQQTPLPTVSKSPLETPWPSRSVIPTPSLSISPSKTVPPTPTLSLSPSSSSSPTPSLTNSPTAYIAQIPSTTPTYSSYHMSITPTEIEFQGLSKIDIIAISTGSVAGVLIFLLIIVGIYIVMIKHRKTETSSFTETDGDSDEFAEKKGVLRFFFEQENRKENPYGADFDNEEIDFAFGNDEI